MLQWIIQNIGRSLLPWPSKNIRVLKLIFRGLVNRMLHYLQQLDIILRVPDNGHLPVAVCIRCVNCDDCARCITTSSSRSSSSLDVDEQRPRSGLDAEFSFFTTESSRTSSLSDGLSGTTSFPSAGSSETARPNHESHQLRERIAQTETGLQALQGLLAQGGEALLQVIRERVASLENNLAELYQTLQLESATEGYGWN
jgi:hypothetical protein